MSTLHEHVWLEADMSAPKALRLGAGSAAVFSRAAGPERPNQDAVAVVSLGDDERVLAVADGAGGMPSGGRAAALAVQQLLASVRSAVEQGSTVRDSVLSGFDDANREIRSLASGAAATLAVVHIEGNRMRGYHAGDSAVLVTGQRGRVKYITMAHSPVGYALEAGVLSEREAMHHADRNVVSNMLGDAEMRIEVGPLLKLATFDTLVLATDGLFDNLHTEEISDLVRRGPLAGAGNDLARAALARMTSPEQTQPSKLDDLSFILYRPR